MLRSGDVPFAHLRVDLIRARDHPGTSERHLFFFSVYPELEFPVTHRSGWRGLVSGQNSFQFVAKLERILAGIDRLHQGISPTAAGSSLHQAGRCAPTGLFLSEKRYRPTGRSRPIGGWPGGPSAGRAGNGRPELAVHDLRFQTGSRIMACVTYNEEKLTPSSETSSSTDLP